MRNDEIARLFDEMADLTQLKGGDDFRAQAYRNTARSIRHHPRPVEEMVEAGDSLTDLQDVGKSNAAKVHEILKKGTCDKLEGLRKAVPPGLTEVLAVPDVGVSTARRMWKELGIESRDDLREAAEAGRIRELKGMGEATEKRILANLEVVGETAGRSLRHDVRTDLAALERALANREELSDWDIAGSVRRRAETVGDIDVLVASRDWPTTADALSELADVRDVIERGDEQLSLRLYSGLRVDVHAAPEASYGAHLLHLTGSAPHNVALRERAQEKDWILNQHGLFSGEQRLAAKTEEAVYKRLGLVWIPPELRENTGEIEAAADDDLPTLLERKQVRAELHCHTTASDGTASIEEMAQAAKELGHKILAITDHSKATAIANGLDEDRMRRHADAIREANERIDGIKLLTGVEVDILKDGALDYDDELLLSLDYVVASVHSSMRQDRKLATSRVVSAIRSGVIHAVGHPLGRKIGQRDQLDLDLDEVFAACAETGVRLEINGQPDRLDLPWDHLRAAKEAGVRFVLGSDAHTTQTLRYLDYCVDVARRGWLEAEDVLNAQPVETMLTWIREFRG